MTHENRQFKRSPVTPFLIGAAVSIAGIILNNETGIAMSILGASMIIGCAIREK